MRDSIANDATATIRIGAVSYLNARPLVFCLQRHLPKSEVVIDLPSRLADGLAEGRFDLAVVPSIEAIRNPDYAVVSDACVACEGPVRSVRLYGRRPPAEIRTLALDEGSRTSATLVRILLKERLGLEPQVVRLPIGRRIEDTRSDAVMLIGDRGMRAVNGHFEFVWDLGEQWLQWTGLPMVFAMWIARRQTATAPLAEALARARDEGVGRLEEIARLAAPALGLEVSDCLVYLRDHLGFRLEERQKQGLALFCRLAIRHGLAPAGSKLTFADELIAP